MATVTNGFRVGGATSELDKAAAVNYSSDFGSTGSPGSDRDSDSNYGSQLDRLNSQSDAEDFPVWAVREKNTFIHVEDLNEAEELHQSPPVRSCPAAPMDAEFKTKYATMGEKLHVDGDCQPCAYMFKPDGCRKGNSCEFCHMCSKKEIKQRKRVKKFTLKAAAEAEPAGCAQGGKIYYTRAD